MAERQRSGIVLVAVLLAALCPAAVVPAAEKDKKDKGTVTGLAIDKKDKTIMVQADGDEEATAYVLPDGADRRLVKAWNSVFHAARVRISYKVNGDKREVVGISRQVGRPRGTVTGVVEKTYGGFWVAVKFKSGLLDAYASRSAKPPPLLKTLEQGDVVTIKYYTDFERHRIESIRKIGTSKKKPKPEKEDK